MVGSTLPPAAPAESSRPVLSRRLAVVAALLALCTLVPYAYTATQVWSATGELLTFNAEEQKGITYLRPLVTLLSDTVDLQTAAVRGEAVDRLTLDAAISSVDRVDQQLGDDLGVRRRWASVRQRLTQFAVRPPTGAAGLRAGSQVVDQLTALLAQVGDASNLILDPQLDSYYVMDALLLRIPAVIVQAGRMTDLAYVAAPTGTATGVAPSTVVVVAQGTLRDAASTLDAGLRKSLAATTSRTLGPALLSQLDVLQAAVNQLAPLDTQVGADPTVPESGTLQPSQRKLRDAAIAVAGAGFGELFSLIKARSDGVERQRRGVLLVGGVGAVAALAVLWFGVGARRRPTVDDDSDEATPTSTVSDDELDLLDARELLGARQLVRVGRAVAPTRDKT